MDAEESPATDERQEDRTQQELATSRSKRLAQDSLSSATDTGKMAPVFDKSALDLLSHVTEDLKLVEEERTGLEGVVEKQRQKYIRLSNFYRALYWILGWPSALLATATGITAIAKEALWTTSLALASAILSVSLNIFRPATARSEYQHAADELSMLETMLGALRLSIQDVSSEIAAARITQDVKALGSLRAAPGRLRGTIVAIAKDFDSAERRMHSGLSTGAGSPDTDVVGP